MRRRLAIFVPILLLAVLVQVIAPIGAFRAFATVVSDPLAMASICSGMSDGGHGSTAPDRGTPMRGDCCGYCAIGHVGAPPLYSPPPMFALLQSVYQRVVWLEPTDAHPVHRAGSNAQARAPPIFS